MGGTHFPGLALAPADGFAALAVAGRLAGGGWVNPPVVEVERVTLEDRYHGGRGRAAGKRLSG
jgi:hypothetical protein